MFGSRKMLEAMLCEMFENAARKAPQCPMSALLG